MNVVVYYVELDLKWIDNLKKKSIFEYLYFYLPIALFYICLYVCTLFHTYGQI